jgi:hypothetical protein
MLNRNIKRKEVKCFQIPTSIITTYLEEEE